MIVWDPFLPNGGNSIEAIKKARLILWKGHCSVHQMFQPAHIGYFRKQYPGVQVIVHPECHEDVVNQADLVGSTEFIIRTVSQAPSGTMWAVGTELIWSIVSSRNNSTSRYFSSLPWCADVRRCIALMAPIFVGPWKILHKGMWSITFRCRRMKR